MKRVYLLQLLFIAFCANSVFCQPTIELDNISGNAPINQFAAVYKSSKVTIKDVETIKAAPDSCFYLNKNVQEVNYGFNKPYSWCKFKLKNNTNVTSWIIKIHQGKVDSVQLYIQRDTGKLIKYRLVGRFDSLKNKPFFSADYANLIFLSPNETITCYLYTSRKFSRHAAIISVEKEQNFNANNQLFNIGIWALFGIIFLVSCIGFVLYYFINDKIYIYYSIYSFAFLTLLLSGTGFLNAFLFNTRFEDIFYGFNISTYYWFSAWHILFTVELLGINKNTGKYGYWLGYTLGIIFCIITFVLLVPISNTLRWWLCYASYYIAFLVDAFVLYAIILSFKRRRTVVVIYLIGFLCTTIVGTILSLADLQVIDGINQHIDIFYITPLVEITCMIISLSFLFSSTIKERINSQIQLNEIQRDIINVQEEERKRIAQDLHDEVGNSLAALKNLVTYNSGKYNIQEEIEHIINEIRNISHNLMPIDFNEYALSTIVRQTIDKFKEHPSIKFEYIQTGDSKKLQPVTELIIYRILNELVSNIIKHSNATKALIQLTYQENSLILLVEDDGIGINNYNNETEKKGLGLKNIKHRVGFINAILTIETNSTGTLIIIETPYKSYE
ncbi:MAG: hypothetical protein JSR09_09370 [Bacteroidetes bacterium]|nr:hypothetical protein [Bacteroidota bacterium]MBS1649899.1 hypothetical protein [Bacteroidota bacterium]